MPKDIPTHNKLLVVSDTGMYKGKDGFYAFGPVVKELEELSCFDKITWIGFERNDQKKNSSYVKIEKEHIQVVLLKKTGGVTLFNKLEILAFYPMYFYVILKEICKARYIHVRAPSNPAVIVMFLSYFFPVKHFWFKYAGDWIGEASKFYKIQRYILKHLFKNAKITVNGNWSNQPKNIVGFENPCLDEHDRIIGKGIIESKQITNTINYCFVGGMNYNKGVDKIIDALEKSTFKNLGEFHFVGGGELLDKLKLKASTSTKNIIFHGFLAKSDIQEIYKKCHFILLPSKSEGFPKVIGEAMNYGCVPIVSDISCISQYIVDEKNGYLISNVTVEEIASLLERSLMVNNTEFKEMVLDNYKLAEKFTYKYYERQILEKIF